METIKWEQKAEWSTIVLSNTSFDEEKFKKIYERGRKEFEERREIAMAYAFREQYERWQRLRNEHPNNTLDFW